MRMILLWQQFSNSADIVTKESSHARANLLNFGR